MLKYSTSHIEDTEVIIKTKKLYIYINLITQF